MGWGGALWKGFWVRDGLSPAKHYHSQSADAWLCRCVGMLQQNRTACSFLGTKCLFSWCLCLIVLLLVGLQKACICPESAGGDQEPLLALRRSVCGK